ncbi:MAG TPA: pitrilysin family protein [Vicinamibacteria bacterium]|nr:pitrilysin family protein [Vicinamibacteria bacterium]
MTVKETLPNGLTLITESMPEVRSVAVGVWLKRGSRHEAEEVSGVSHFIEHMVFKGTETRSAERIASEVDSIGGYMDAFTAKEYASFHLKVLDEHLPLAVEILGDVVLHPLFDPLEMAKEKKVIFEEMSMVEDTPDDLVMEIFAEAFWPAHPLGRPILGTRRTVGRFRREDLASYFARVYQPANILIAAAGHLEHGEVAALVSRHFAGLENGPTPKSPRGPAGRSPGKDGRPPSVVARTVTRSKKELEQVHVCLGARAHPQAHPDRYAGYLLNTVLGGSMSSRLFQNVREKRGLVYSISSGITAYSDAGLLSIYAGTSLESAPEVIRLALEEVRRLRGEPLGGEELRRAKDHIKGGLVLSLEGSGSRMNHLARQEIYFGRQIPLDEILGGIESVTAPDVQRVAAKVFDGRLGASILGNLEGWRPRERDFRV